MIRILLYLGGESKDVWGYAPFGICCPQNPPRQTGVFIDSSPLNYPVVLGLDPSCVEGVESIKLAGMK